MSGKPGNRFVGHPDGVIEVAFSSSVSRLYRPVEVDLDATPVLTFVRTVGPARATPRIGLANPVTNMRRLPWLERQSALA